MRHAVPLLAWIFNQDQFSAGSAQRPLLTSIPRSYTILPPLFPAGGSPHICIIAGIAAADTSLRSPHYTKESTKNVTTVVRAFLASIQAQHYTNWELHLVNSKGGGEVFQDEIARLADLRMMNGPSFPARFKTNT